MLLDLDQKTLPGVAHQVVEQMVITDQIRAEDRANVLRALLLKHRSARGAVATASLSWNLPPGPTNTQGLRVSTDSLALSHSHPSDEKDFFPRNISAGSLGSLLGHHHSTNHVGEASEPAVTEPLIASQAAEHETRVDVEREVSSMSLPPCP